MERLPFFCVTVPLRLKPLLGEFWAELRDKSRVRIEHPDLQAAAGELVATLWSRSTASARAALDAQRADAEAGKAAAHAAVTSIQTDLVRTETALEQRTAALLAAQVRVQELEQVRDATSHRTHRRGSAAVAPGR